MPCFHPSEVDVLRRSTSESARRADSVRVPCGSCDGCRMDRASQWATRIIHESEFPRLQPSGDPRAAWFATLTYSEENLPDHGSLVPEDCRAFLARLRKRFPPRTVSYYLVGEYGDESNRPHYHAVLYGPRFLARDYHTERNGAAVWIADAVQDAWQLGITEITGLTSASARYVAGYVWKKQRRRRTPHYEFDPYERVVPETGEIVEVEPEFSRMSRNPAIGRRWIHEYWRDVYPRDFVVIDGRERKPPRYYDKQMEEIAPQVMEEVRHQRFIDAVEIGDEKLIMKEKVLRARMGLFSSRSKI